jgi:uncharacterized delta-60 repeat protein
VTAIDLQTDGKIIVNVSGSDARRLKTDGSLDIIFPDTQNALDVRVASDGKVLIAGGNYIKRFNANGTLDAAFGPTVNNRIAAMVLQPDGKILIAGDFTQVNGTPRGRVARLNTDGTVDMTFDTATGASHSVHDVALQADGKVVIAGRFTGVNFAPRLRIARLNPDGSLDVDFSPSAGSDVDTLEVQANGKILLGGLFGSVNGVARDHMARLNPDGSLDASFDPQLEFDILTSNPRVSDIEIQTDGRILAAGDFESINGASKLGIARLLNTPSRPLFDYDGDGKADVSVFRPSENRWYVFKSSDSTVSQTVFAIAGDVPVPADYDGDLKTDIAIYRPSNGAWWYQSSLNGAQINVNWGGEAGDVPRPSDFDGDGKADFVFFRPTNNFWYRITSSGTVSNVQFGLAGDKPVTGDFDGDGKSDVAIYRPSTGDWWYQSSINGAQLAVRWGISTDIPAPADYDGDGRTDFAVYRPSTGVWYVINSSNGSFLIGPFGIPEDKPVPADYDGDGKAELAVFRPSTGIWYQLRTSGGFFAMQFGISSDTPTPNAFVPLPSRVKFHDVTKPSIVDRSVRVCLYLVRTRGGRGRYKLSCEFVQYNVRKGQQDPGSAGRQGIGRRKLPCSRRLRSGRIGSSEHGWNGRHGLSTARFFRQFRHRRNDQCDWPPIGREDPCRWWFSRCEHDTQTGDHASERRRNDRPYL